MTDSCVTTRRQLLKKRHSSLRPFGSPALSCWEPTPTGTVGIHYRNYVIDPPYAYSVLHFALHRTQGCTGAVYNMSGCIPKAVCVWALQPDGDGR